MYSILPLAEEFSERIFSLERECFEDPWSETAIRSAFSYPNALIFGLFDGDSLIGYYFSSYVMQEAELMNLCVLPGYRRQGLGAKLLSHLKAILIQHGVKELFLEVREGNLGARAIYRKTGFVKVGLRIAYYQNNGVNAVLMRSIQ